MMFRSRGFSLIELATVIAIIGTLMALGIPSFQTWLRNVKIRNAAESLQNGLQFARMEALRRNERVSFWMVSGALDSACSRSGSGGSWIVGRDDPAANCDVAPSESTAPRAIQKHDGRDGSTSVTVGSRPAVPMRPPAIR